jgi:hypothetical protein
LPTKLPDLSVADLCLWGYLMEKLQWKEESTTVEIWLFIEATATI